MGSYQRVVAAPLIVCLVLAPFGDWLATVRAAGPSDLAVTRQQLELFGVGTAVEVTLASGQKLKGSVIAIHADGFDLVSGRDDSPRRITYGAITELKLKVKSTYKSSGRPDVAEARRVVAGLGRGRHVQVKVASGQKVRGHLEAITQDGFSVVLDRGAGQMPLAYGDVQELGPNLSRGAKIAIWAAVGVGLLLLWALAEQPCCL